VVTRYAPTLAARLRAGETLLGLIAKMPAPAVIETAGHAGFDFAMVDTEHGVADTGSLEHHLRAADSAGLAALVRVGANEPIDILRALDAGAAGIVVPHVNDAGDAHTAVRAAYYPPHGDRGLAVSTRAGRQGLASVEEHVGHASNNTLVVVQLEDASALAHAGEIACTDRVDAVFIGPNDLSISLGYPGQPGHPDVVAAIDRIAEDIVAAERAALCVLVSDEDEARIWRSRGARLLMFSAAALLSQRLAGVVRGVRVQDGLPAPQVIGNHGRVAKARP
jgi:4-hydroxy-2-oxoheptanedioate aldolase